MTVARTTAGTKPARLERDEGKQAYTSTYTRKSRALRAIPERPCVIIVPNPRLNLAQSMLGEMSHKPSAGLTVKSVIFALSHEATSRI